MCQGCIYSFDLNRAIEHYYEFHILHIFTENPAYVLVLEMIDNSYMSSCSTSVF